MGLVLFGAGGSWVFSARHWFTGPVINLGSKEEEEVDLEKDKKMFKTQSKDDVEEGVKVSEVETVAL